MAINLGRQLDVDSASTSSTHEVQAVCAVQEVESTSSATGLEVETTDALWDLDVPDDILMSMDNNVTAKPVNFAPVFNNCSNVTINFGSIN